MMQLHATCLAASHCLSAAALRAEVGWRDSCHMLATGPIYHSRDAMLHMAMRPIHVGCCLCILQAAVPKYMQLRLEPATGTSIPALGGGLVTQALHVTNTMHGQKPLVMRLRLNYSKNGQPVMQQVEVNFPAGF